MAVKSSGFNFKRFRVNHDRCAMKVGTDGILLGSWADVSQAGYILDLGSGTGLIALMLAQRSLPTAKIDAVEIELNAVAQAEENIRNSPWPEKITLYHQDIADFGRTVRKKFDLITANPPYFTPGMDCRSNERNMARYTVCRSHLDWLNIAATLVAETGKIQFILPYQAGKTLIKQTALFCTQYCEVFTKPDKAPQRLLLTFSRQAAETENGRITVYDRQNRYHPDFVGLTKDFYLKF